MRPQQGKEPLIAGMNVQINGDRFFEKATQSGSPHLDKHQNPHTRKGTEYFFQIL